MNTCCRAIRTQPTDSRRGTSAPNCNASAFAFANSRASSLPQILKTSALCLMHYTKSTERTFENFCVAIANSWVSSLHQILKTSARYLIYYMTVEPTFENLCESVISINSWVSSLHQILSILNSELMFGEFGAGRRPMSLRWRCRNSQTSALLILCDALNRELMF